MKIITWNVRRSNKKIQQLIEHALSYEPDVLCFQEFPKSYLPFVTGYGYTASYAYDFITKKSDSGLICTFTKNAPMKRRIVEYSNIRSGSLLNRIVYLGITGSTEQHCSPIVVVDDNGKSVQIVNARLSCAVGTLERLREFKTILSHLDPTLPTVLAGDFNIVDNTWFNILTGWARGFHWNEYFLNERAEFEKVVQSHGYRNIFRKHSTSFTNRPILQFDHILIPNGAGITSSAIDKKRFGSDHRMLFADLTFPVLPVVDTEPTVSVVPIPSVVEATVPSIG